MFRRILVPIDGSSEARAAGRQAIELAQSIGASVIALHVAPPFQSQYFADFVPPPDTTNEMWQAGLRKVADRHFEPLRDAALQEGVPLTTEVVFEDHPAQAIEAAARRNGCDLIVMGPRGHGGVADYLLGSVTQRVLAASRVPVLVHRVTV
jgi:nucleotide-binding universal stress UspA family protein